MPTIVSREKWLEQRLQHLADEKEFTRAREALSAKRRQLPWVLLEQDYLFEGDGGPVRLSELFGGHSQLIIYHFMYGEDWQAGCPSCSFWADNFNTIGAHLGARDAGFAAISIALLSNWRNTNDAWVGNLLGCLQVETHLTETSMSVPHKKNAPTVWHNITIKTQPSLQMKPRE